MFFYIFVFCLPHSSYAVMIMFVTLATKKTCETRVVDTSFTRLPHICHTSVTCLSHVCHMTAPFCKCLYHVSIICRPPYLSDVCHKTVTLCHVSGLCFAHLCRMSVTCLPCICHIVSRGLHISVTCLSYVLSNVCHMSLTRLSHVYSILSHTSNLLHVYPMSFTSVICLEVQ